LKKTGAEVVVDMKAERDSQVGRQGVGVGNLEVVTKVATGDKG
jgi:hypothetical protein